MSNILVLNVIIYILDKLYLGDEENENSRDTQRGNNHGVHNEINEH